jgi:tripartite motif-containing protein 69
MELNLNQLQEQCLLAKDMLESIQTRMEQQNSFDFLKVRFHTNKIMHTLRWGKRAGRDVAVVFHH